MIVKIAVDKIPNPNVYFPPNFSDKIPPGTCTNITYITSEHLQIKSWIYVSYDVTPEER